MEIFLEVGSAKAEPWRDLQKQSFGDPQVFKEQNRSNHIDSCRYASISLRLFNLRNSTNGDIEQTVENQLEESRLATEAKEQR